MNESTLIVSNVSQLEAMLTARIQPYLTSASHGIDHILQVLAFARQLQQYHGGDLEVITAAVYLHDLARAYKDIHRKASVDKSVELARPILQEIGLPEDKVSWICDAIAEHDQPGVRPHSVEGKILKDADFLAGFGAQGIARAAMWTGESNEPSREFLFRLDTKMPSRIASLEFPESKRLAEQQYTFVKLFLEMLGSTPQLSPQVLGGYYIVIEGTSGTGKDTQAAHLCNLLQERGREVTLVTEPSSKLVSVRRDWKRHLHSAGDGGLFGQLLLYTLDRYVASVPTVQERLAEGQVVISVRNYLSSMVYQSATDAGPGYVAFLHRFAPRPDLLILLDAPAEVAWSRIEERYNRSGRQLGDFESLSMLADHRERYLRLTKEYFPRNVIIDASLDVDSVGQAVWAAVKGSLIA